MGRWKSRGYVGVCKVLEGGMGQNWRLDPDSGALTASGGIQCPFDGHQLPASMPQHSAKRLAHAVAFSLHSAHGVCLTVPS